MATQNEAFVGRLSAHLEPSECLYAVGQGALAVEIVESDMKTAEKLRCLHHEPTCLRVVAERAFMFTLDGGCSSPIAVSCDFNKNGELVLQGAVFSTDGSESLYQTVTKDLSVKTEGTKYEKTYTGILPQQIELHKIHGAYELGKEVADLLVEKGAGKIIAEAKALNNAELKANSQCPFPFLKNLVLAVSLYFSLSLTCPVKH